MSNEICKRLEVSKGKQAMLEETYRVVQNGKPLSHADELTLESLTRRIARLRDEIAQFNVPQSANSH